MRDTAFPIQIPVCEPAGPPSNMPPTAPTVGAAALMVVSTVPASTKLFPCCWIATSGSDQAPPTPLPTDSQENRVR